MNIKKLMPDHPDIPLLDKLYMEAFPPSERLMSMEEIFACLDKMPIEILGIYPAEAPELFSGFFVTFVQEKFVYLVFFATCAEMRSTGIGSKAIKALVEFYSGKPIIFSYESVFEESDNLEQRKRRRAFYLRNGFHETGWFGRMNNTEFIIASSEEKVDESVLKELRDNPYTPSYKVELYRRDVDLAKG